MQHIIKKEDIIDVLSVIQEFGDKFPMLKLNQINFYELAKFYKRKPYDFMAVVVLLDAMRETNQSSNKNISYYIDIEKVSKIKVRRKKDIWKFQVYKSAEEKMEIVHEYAFDY